MVEINNQRKAFLDMLAWSEGTDNGRQKTRNHGYDVIVGGNWYWLLDHPRKLVTLNQNSNQQAPVLPASFPLSGCLRSKRLKDFSPKSQDAVALQQIKERGALPMIDRGDIRQAIDRCSNIWASLPGAGYGQFKLKADSLMQNSKKRAEQLRDWCMSRVTAIISALVITIIVCLSWAVNHYIDNAITYKAQRDKNARELKLANAAITDMQMRQRRLAALDAKYTKELADAKSGRNDALRDDVAAGRRRLHIKAVCQSVREATTASGVDNRLPTGRHRWTGLFHPQREADHYAKTTGKTVY